MKSIAIILGDNDFGNTMRPLLLNLADALTYGPDDLDETYIQRLVHEGMPWHYKAYQNRGSYGDEADAARVGAYLQDNAYVLYNAAADHAVKNEDHDSGAWYMSMECPGEVISF